MKLLDRIEQSIERLMEGSVGRVFRSPVQPAEIGRKLERAMTANLAPSVDHPIAPNDYQVRMHPDDLAHVAGYATSLTRQFETWLAATASERGYAVIDRVSVQMIGDGTVRRHEIRVAAVITDQPRRGREQQEIQRTEVYRAVRESSEITAIRLQVVDGPGPDQEYIIRDPVTTIGRSLDNAVVLDSTDVSRHHARLEISGRGMRITDLGSTNGTSVNGAKIRTQELHVGDEVTFGSLRLSIAPVVSRDGRD